MWHLRWLSSHTIVSSSRVVAGVVVEVVVGVVVEVVVGVVVAAIVAGVVGFVVVEIAVSVEAGQGWQWYG